MLTYITALINVKKFSVLVQIGFKPCWSPTPEPAVQPIKCAVCPVTDGCDMSIFIIKPTYLLKY